MGISRRKPDSDEGREAAIIKAVAQLSAVPPAQVTLTIATQTRLAAINISFTGAMGDKRNALAAQSTATSTKDEAEAKARMFVSHWFQSFNNGIERNLFTKEQRAYFGIDINDGAVPLLASEDDVLKWGNRIKDKDPVRVAAGGAAMGFPSTAEVNTEMAAFILANTAQGLKITAFEDALALVAANRDEADKVILKVWDETETFYNELAPPAKRQRCRPWGVVYVSDVVVTINLTVLKETDNSAIEGASNYLVEGDTTHITNALGQTEVKTSVADLATFVTTATGFIQKTTEVEIVSGTLVYNVTIKLAAV